MSEWKLVKFQEIGSIERGRSRHRPRYASHLYGGKYPFIQTGDIRASGGRITTYSQTYNEAGLAQSRLWDVGTLCITIAANIAETGILTFPACFPDSVIGFIADQEKCDVYFIEYLFRLLKPQIKDQASGSAQDNINLETLKRISFPLPPLREQKRIVHILGALDDKIQANRQMNTTLEATARAIFQSWFVNFDPVHAKARGEMPYGMDVQTADLFPDDFVESELGMIPRGWQVGSLIDIANYVNGLALQKFPPKNNDYLPVIKIRELRQGISDTQSDKADIAIPEKIVVADGDMIFSWSGSLLIDLWGGGLGALNQHLFKVTSANYPQWFYYFWTQKHLQEFIGIAENKATTMGHIQRNHLESALVCIPSNEYAKHLLQKGTEIIQPFLEKLIASRIEIRTLTEIRNALLPKLISDEILIPDFSLGGEYEKSFV